MSAGEVRVGEVLHLRRTAVAIDPTSTYKEIGLRSFGKGVFHKEPVSGSVIGDKRVFEIVPGDLLLSNVFAWEGAIAVAGPSEAGRIGSHRFMTYVPRDGRIDTSWARRFFLSEEGLELIRAASPGSAGRNRTLGIEAFESLRIPLPSIEEQLRVAQRLDDLAEATSSVVRLGVRSQLVSQLLLASWLRTCIRSTGAATRRLEEIAEVRRGRGPTYVEGSGSVVLSQACVRWAGLDLRNAREVDQAWWDSVPRHDRAMASEVLVNSTGEGTIGRACLAGIRGEGLPIDSHVLGVRVDAAVVIPEYLVLYLRSPDGQASIDRAKGANTTKQTELGKAKLEALEVPTPPTQVQQRLVDRFRQFGSELDQLSALRAASDKLVAALPKAASNEAFSLLR